MHRTIHFGILILSFFLGSRIVPRRKVDRENLVLRDYVPHPSPNFHDIVEWRYSALCLVARRRNENNSLSQVGIELGTVVVFTIR